jgi:hypothetical protein
MYRGDCSVSHREAENQGRALNIWTDIFVLNFDRNRKLNLILATADYNDGVDNDDEYI